MRLDVHGRSLTVTPGFSIEDLVAGIADTNGHDLALSGERGGERIDE